MMKKYFHPTHFNTNIKFWYKNTISLCHVFTCNKLSTFKKLRCLFIFSPNKVKPLSFRIPGRNARIERETLFTKDRILWHFCVGETSTVEASKSTTPASTLPLTDQQHTYIFWVSLTFTDTHARVFVQMYMRVWVCVWIY